MSFDAITSPFQKAASELVAAGFHVIPIEPREKRPYPRYTGRWPKFRDEAPTAELMETWSGLPDANIGIVLGSGVGDFQVVAVDIDTEDPDETDEIVRSLPHSPMSKRGKKGLTLFYLASKSMKSRGYKDQHDRGLADLLTGKETKQTVVPPSIHPSEVPYTWLGGIVPASELPVLTDEDLRAFEETLMGFGWRETRDTDQTIVSSTDDPFQEVKLKALERLSDWVPQLNLHKLERVSGGYRAVPHWRESSSGRALDDRGTNLSITSTGIRDHGADVGYSAIDLVMAALSIESHEACSWLEDRLGMTVCEVVDLSPRIQNQTNQEFTDLPPCPLANEIIRWIEESAPFPLRSFSIGAAFSLISTVVGRQYCTPERSGGLNLFVLGLAPSGSGKNHPLNAIKQILANQEFARNLGPSTWTAASVLEKELVASPVLLSVIDEYGDSLKKMTRRNTTIAEESKIRTIKEMFSIGMGSYQTQSMAQSSRQTIEAPHFSMFAAATPQTLYGNLTSDLIEGGFLNRWLVLNERGRTHKRTVQDELARRCENRGSLLLGADRISDMLLKLKKRRGDIVEARSAGSSFKIEPLAAVWDNQALEMWLKYQIETTDWAIEKGEDFALFFSRAAEIALRLATLISIANKCDDATDEIVVEPDPMDWAIRFVDQAMKKTFAEAGERTHQSGLAALRDRLLKYISSKNEWVTHSQVSRALGRQFDDARQLRNQLNFLVESGELKLKNEKSGNGRDRSSYAVST